ncbi:MAG: hypothetical protein J1G02_06220 [Clostridiales bacterium]|nr:hypothetical protein [Clostridiales bacterium]
MKKKLLAAATVILVLVVCVSALIGCDGSSRFVKSIGCHDYLHETGVNIVMSKRLPKTAVWNSDMEAIKYKGGLSELFELMQMQDGYTKTLHDEYILIETTKNGRLYTWGIFSTSVWGDDYDGEYSYVLTTMGCDVTGNGWSMFFFPIYTMERPLLWWKDGQSYKCNITMDELSDFYTRHGYTVEAQDNVLKVATPICKWSNGDEHGELWDVTFHSDGTVSVGNFLEQEIIYD